MNESPVRPIKDRPVRLLTVVVTLTLVTLGWLSWTAYRNYRFVNKQLPVISRMEELRDEIVLFDEVLTMSARMAAATGDLKWEARYRQVGPQLDRALKEAMRLVPGLAGSQAAAQTDAANTRLVVMEKRAFELVRQGQQPKAQQLLSGKEYETQKKVYAAGMTELNRLMKQVIASARARQQDQTLWSIGTAAISVMLLILGWWFVVRATRQWQTALTESNEKLNRHAEELKKITHNLDEEVNERTKQLNESKSALLNMMEDAVRNRDKVEEAYTKLKREVAERKKVEEQLRQSQKMEGIGQLAGGVAHDFNNILTVIQGHATLAQMGEKLPPSVTESIKQISRASERAANLTRQLLMFSRKQVLEVATLDLNQVVTDMTKMLRRIIGEQVTLDCSFHPQPLLVKADAGMLEQVLMNLAVNARDAMPQGGSLAIRTSIQRITDTEVRRNTEASTGDFVCLTVTDTGCGIAPENLDRIFEPFFTTKEVGKGTGLGLATVYGIVKQHNGWIKVASEPREGTRFEIFLPQTLDAPAKASGDTSRFKKTAQGSETILVVEDEEPVRELVSSILGGYGYRVLEAGSGEDALRIWRKQKDKIALLLTDLVMPGGMMGRELGQRLLADKPQLKVIYTSGYNTETTDGNFALREGLNYLHKPYDPAKLAEIVRNCLDHSVEKTDAPAMPSKAALTAAFKAATRASNGKSDGASSV